MLKIQDGSAPNAGRKTTSTALSTPASPALRYAPLQGRGWSAKPVRLLLYSLLLLLVVTSLGLRVWRSAAAPALLTTKTVALHIDKNNNRQAERGDTLRYTITITNASAADSTDVTFIDLLAANTTVVPGSIQTTPLAQDDHGYSTVGNVQLTAPITQSLLLNDSDPDGSGGLTVSAFTATSTSGGTVQVAADGRFTYNPPPGFSGVDTFGYTAADGEGNTVTATASITVGQVVWFINNAASGPGDGRLTTPFATIADFTAAAVAKAGDIIFIYQGTRPYSSTLTLRNTQQLIGQGVGLTMAPNLAIPATTRPTLANVILANGNTVRGLNLNTSSGSSLSGGNVGALTLNNVAITSSGTRALALSGGSTAMTVTLDSVTVTGGTTAVSLTDNRGQVTINGGTIQNTNGPAISLFNNSGMLAFTLRNSTITTLQRDGLRLDNKNSGGFGVVTVQNNTFANNDVGIRVNLTNTGSLNKLEVSGNTFTSNNTAVELITNDTATLLFDLHDNATIHGDDTQLYLAANDKTPLDGVGPTMAGYIRRNTLRLNPAFYGIGIWAVKSGDGNATFQIMDNQITGFGDSGIAVESLIGMGTASAIIANNVVSTTVPAVAGLYLRNGDGSSNETTKLCVNLSGNQIMNGGGGVDYLFERANPNTTTFQIQGLAPSPATPAEAADFVETTDLAPSPTAAVAPGSYLNAVCNPVLVATVPAVTVVQPAIQDQARVPPAAPPVALSQERPTWRSRGASILHTLATTLVAPFWTPVYADGERVDLTLGTLRTGHTMTLSFDVTIDTTFANPELCNQATISAANVSAVATDDPTKTGSADPTCIAILLPDMTPPETRIDSSPPPVSTSAAASFTFSGTDNATAAAELTFACKLDSNSFTPCTSPQSYSALSDGLHTFQVRAIDALGNVDPTPSSFTWNINPIIPVADLAVTQSNNVNDYALPGQAWLWTIQVRNHGDAAATFAAGQTLLLDNLPAGNLTYATPTLVSSTDITDTANLGCTLVNNDLICAANGGAVTLAAHTGAFTVQLSAMADVVGDYANPRPDGRCRVDPDDVLNELNEGNNTCDNAVTVGAPDLALTKRHTGNFLLGQADASYTLTVQNVGSGPTTGVVTVTDDLPAGLMATALTGTGWHCTLAPLSCSRTDVLAAGSTYPQLTLTVAVTNDTPATLLNQATVTVAHDTDLTNNMATDATELVSVNMWLFLPIITRN